MTTAAQSILLVDPDIRARTFLGGQIEPLGLRVLESSDADGALRILALEDVRLVITELYLPTGAEPCLICATRKAWPSREVSIIAHTHRSLDEDRAWALKAGADAYLIKPTRAARVRYVVGRLLTARPNAAPAGAGPMLRRDSLDEALAEIETGSLEESSCIVFGREWWQSLVAADRMAYRLRAKAARVSLRSDSEIGAQHVEIRGKLRPELALSTEQPESPYRRS